MAEISTNRVDDAVIDRMCESAHNVHAASAGNSWHTAPRAYRKAVRTEMRAAYSAIREHIDNELNRPTSQDRS